MTITRLIATAALAAMAMATAATAPAAAEGKRYCGNITNTAGGEGQLAIQRERGSVRCARAKQIARRYDAANAAAKPCSGKACLRTHEGWTCLLDIAHIGNDGRVVFSCTKGNSRLTANVIRAPGTD